MSDYTDPIYQKVIDQRDPFKKILDKIPGFKGYMERQARRDSDKILRETIADRFEALWQRVSAIQKDFISSGQIDLLDDLESAAIKLRTFSDRVRRATRGYTGLFDAIKINEAELQKIYAYDATLLDLADEVSRSIDNLEASIGSDGLPAAIRNLITVSRQAVEAFDRRQEVIFNLPTDTAATG
jgi:hypothetical protein